MGDHNCDAATLAWIEVVALLTAAADGAAPATGLDPAQRSLAFGAQVVACDATALLSKHLDEQIEAFVLPPGAVTRSIGDLIADADRAATRHPAYDRPPGADAVVARLEALRLEAGS